jgi:ArsR family transcriptional regulator
MTFSLVMDSRSVETTSVESSAVLFAAMSDPTRIQILDLLTSGRMCVCDINASLPGVAPNLLSYHLRVLREAGLVETSRRGRWVDYELSPSASRRVMRSIPHGLLSQEGT